MKLLNSIRKKWLQHRVYKYLLKSQDALSKSEQLLELSKNYEALALEVEREFGIYHRNEKIKHLHVSSKYALKSEHYEHLADIYSRKRVDLDTQLCNLSYRKV